MNNKFTFTLGEFHANETGVDIKDANVSVEHEATPEETTKSIEALNRVLPELKKVAGVVIDAINNRNTNPQMNEIVDRLNNASMAFTQQDQRIGNVEAHLNSIINYLQSQAQPTPQQPTQPAQSEAVNADLMKVVSDLIQKAAEEKTATTKTTPKK